MIATDLKDQLHGWRGKGSEYTEKQVHPVPDAPVVDRSLFFLQKCRGKIVLDIGASGPMHDGIVAISKKCYGIDRQDGPGVVGVNLDDYHAKIPFYPDAELVVLGEVIEHLSNPGWCLSRLRAAYKTPILLSVPNAYADIGSKLLEKGIDNTNIDHVAYYSWRTLKTLLEREGYRINEFAYYNGRKRFSEGLIVVAE